MRVPSTQQISLLALAIIALIAPDCCLAEQPKIGRGKSWVRSPKPPAAAPRLREE